MRIERDGLKAAPHSPRSIAMLSIPYTYLAFSFCLLVVFVKIGELDKEIGWAIGLGTGVLALVLNHYFIGGCFGLAIYGVGGFVLLTVYKIIKPVPDKTRNDDTIEHADSSRRPKGRS